MVDGCRTASSLPPAFLAATLQWQLRESPVGLTCPSCGGIMPPSALVPLVAEARTAVGDGYRFRIVVDSSAEARGS